MLRPLKLDPIKDQIVEMYKSGMTVTEIAKSLGEYQQAVYNVLKRHGDYVTPMPDKGNTRYFQSIDTRNKAYFLGFICADGCIQNFTASSKGLSITLDVKDIEILQKLKEEIGNSHDIRVWDRPITVTPEKSTTMCRFQIADEDLYNDLMSHGITPRKSMTLDNVIQHVPKDLRSAFIIGYFDGDGSVFLPTKHNVGSINISIRGTEAFLQSILDELEMYHRKLHFHKTYVLNISSKIDVLTFFNLYNNCDFYLKRKYNKFLLRINQVQTISSPTPS